MHTLRSISILLSAVSLTAGCHEKPSHGPAKPAAPAAHRSAPAAHRSAPAAQAMPPPRAVAMTSPRARPMAARPRVAMAPRSGPPRREQPPRPRSGFAPCEKAAPGLTCIPGGPFLRGTNRYNKNARPQQKIVVSTFYMDTYEQTNPAFVACVKAGLCEKPRAFMRYVGFTGDRQPAVPVSWFNALSICLMQGKRLPTETEWEKAARTTDGRIFPWGNQGPTCHRAAFRGCKPDHTRNVGSFAPNPYGLYDMAGNGYEWVMDWYTPCWAGCKHACGADCTGRDPRGPCQGTLQCKDHKKRVLRGGSWYWATSHLRTFWRRPEHPKTGNHRLSVRCATRSAHPTPRSPDEVRSLLKRLQTQPLPL